MTIGHFGATPASALLGELSLSGGFAANLNTQFAQGGFRFLSNGTASSFTNVGSNQLNPDTDWITPRTSFDPADYEIRWHEVSRNDEGFGGTLNGPFFSSGWSESTFLPLSSTKQVYYEAVDNNPFGDPMQEIIDPIGFGWNIVLTFEIRFQDGSNTTRNPITSTFDAANVAEVGVFYNIFLGSGIA